MSHSDFHWRPFERDGARALLQRHQHENLWLAPRLPTGPHDRLSDVAGVRVGHCTLADGEVQSGCSALDMGATPARPLPCGIAILNGFAKPVGLTQVAELGTISGPILLGNTYSIGALFDASIQWATRQEPQLGRELPTFNPVALECNDGFLNDLQARALRPEHALAAINSAAVEFDTGAVGAGRGMSCFGLKGGIGTASRMVTTATGQWTLGALVLSNFGKAEDFTLDGVRLGPWLAAHLQQHETAHPEDAATQPEKGSIIIVLATDAPLDKRQLDRVARRAGVGIGRTGGYWGHGSGDIALAVSTTVTQPLLEDHTLDPLFKASADATEAAIINALLNAEPVTGFRQHQRTALSDWLTQLHQQLS